MTLTKPSITLAAPVCLQAEFVKVLYEHFEYAAEYLLLKKEGSGVRAYYSRTIDFTNSRLISRDYDGLDSKEFADDCWFPAPKTADKDSKQWCEACDIAADQIEAMIHEIEFQIENFLP